jgi:hypothetical protein
MGKALKVLVVTGLLTVTVTNCPLGAMNWSEVSPAAAVTGEDARDDSA